MIHKLTYIIHSGLKIIDQLINVVRTDICSFIFVTTVQIRVDSEGGKNTVV